MADDLGFVPDSSPNTVGFVPDGGGNSVGFIPDGGQIDLSKLKGGSVNQPSQFSEGQITPQPGDTGLTTALGKSVKPAWDFINEPIGDHFKESPQQMLIRNAREAQLANAVSPDTEAPELNTPSPVTAGVVMGTENLLKGFTSPLGIATLGIGALPRTAQKIAAAAFATQMAKDVPQQASQLGEEFGKPEEQQDKAKIAQLITEGLGNVGMAGLAGAHAVGESVGKAAQVATLSSKLATAPLDEVRLSQAAPTESRPFNGQSAPFEPMTGEGIQQPSEKAPEQMQFKAPEDELVLNANPEQPNTGIQGLNATASQLKTTIAERAAANPDKPVTLGDLADLAKEMSFNPAKTAKKESALPVQPPNSESIASENVGEVLPSQEAQGNVSLTKVESQSDLPTKDQIRALPDDELKSGYQWYNDQAKDALENKDFQGAVELATRAQWHREALQDRSETPTVKPNISQPEVEASKNAPVESPAPPEQSSPTSIKNAQVDQERAARGLPPAMEPARRSFGAVWDNVMSKFDKDPTGAVNDQNDLINELRNKPRAITDEEDATLLHRQIELQNEYQNLSDAQNKAVDEGRPENAQQYKVQLARVSDQLHDLYDINKRVGTETGRGLSARRMMSYEDYSLAAMETKLRSTQDGKPLSDEQRAQIEDLNQRLTEAQKRIDEYEAAREQPTPRYSDYVLKAADRVVKALEGRANEARKRIAARSGQLNIGIDPALLRDYAEIGAYHLTKAGVDFAKWSAAMIDEFKGLSKASDQEMRDLFAKSEQLVNTESDKQGPTQSDKVRSKVKGNASNFTSPQARLKALKSRLENRIAALTSAIKNRAAIVKRQGPKISTPEIEALRKEKDELTKDYVAMFGKQRAPLSAEAKLKMIKSNYTKRIDELSQKTAAGDFSKKVVNKLPLDAEATKLKAAYERAKLEFDRLAMKERLKNRTMLEKTQDTFVKWRRAFLLSSPVTLAKLTAAAIERGVFTPTEEAVGGVMSKLPVLYRVAQMAPREGGINVKAEAKALTEGFTKGMQDAYTTLKTGHSDLDSLYGKRDVMPRSMIDFIGSIHGALKAPVKRAEFARSFEKRAQFAINQGQDVTDPLIQTKIAVAAFKDAQRSIFMQDNKVSAAWNAGLAILKSPDKQTGQVPAGRKALATVAQTAVPIVKVPTNIVAETLQYAFGSVTGATRLALALRKGVENLKPDEADLIMRELKKGSLGSALMLTGYLSPQLFGGYYQQNDRKQLGHPKFGSVQIGGVNVPSFLVHNPLLETLQIGATIRHVADSKLRKSDADKQGLMAGSVAAGLGLAEEVPFMRTITDLSKLFNSYERHQFMNEYAKDLIVPLGVSWVAQHFDRDAQGNYIARDPKTLQQEIESALPGLREKVPAKRHQPVK